MIGELFLGTGLSLLAGLLYRRSARSTRFSLVTGLTRASVLLMILPASTTQQVTSRLQPDLQRKLSTRLARTRRLKARVVSRLALDTLLTLWQEVDSQRASGDSLKAWIELAENDPELAAQICTHLCASEP